MKTLPFDLEGRTERAIGADARWRAGLAWGRPRPGHPEGAVAAHVAEVLANIDAANHDGPQRARLRLIALVHDSFKGEVDTTRPRTGDNHHALIARRFAEAYIDDEGVLEVIETHDEAYNAWSTGARRGDWGKAYWRASRLLERLGSHRELYLHFFAADNATGDKTDAPYRWFAELEP